MLKRHLLSALVLFSFINVCAYGGGWFDFLLPRSNPDQQLQNIAERWMQDRRALEVGTSDGTVREGVHNPLDNEGLIADFNHLRRFIGWNVLFQEINALMEMELDGEDLPRRDILIQELINTFCTQLGCGPFDGQHARAAALEFELLKLLRSGDFNWDSFKKNVNRLIQVYGIHIEEGVDFAGARSAPIGYWSCTIRLLSQEYLISIIEELETSDPEDLDVRGLMVRNFGAQALQYIHGLFRGEQLFHNYNEDLGSWEWRGRLRNLVGPQRSIILNIRRALALNIIEQQQAMLAGSNEAVHVVADKKNDSSKDDSDDSDEEDDQPDEENRDDKEKRRNSPMKTLRLWMRRPWP